MMVMDVGSEMETTLTISSLEWRVEDEVSQQSRTARAIQQIKRLLWRFLRSHPRNNSL